MASVNPDQNSPFSHRIRDTRAGIGIEKSWPDDRLHPNDPLVLVAAKRLLVAASYVDDVVQQLNNDFGVSAESVTTLFGGVTRLIAEAGVEDIHVLELGQPQDAAHDIFAITNRLRSGYDDADKGNISPDHVLIPDMHGDSCPAGAPMPVGRVKNYTGPWDGVDPPKGGGSASVVVIDAGYIASAAGDLPTYADVTPHKGQVLKNGQWDDSAWDTPDENNDHKLDALAGHANFVAGLFGLYAQQKPDIDLWNHNSGFQESLTQNGHLDVPLESAVCWSLTESLRTKVGDHFPPVIYLGFSFAPDAGIVPQCWISTFAAVITRARTINKATPLLFAPVGNQDRQDRRFPAAMNTHFRDQYPWVIGVGSLQPNGVDRSTFSNYGDWVTCAAIGEDVTSTFLNLPDPIPPEEAAGAPQEYKGWARWSGTSFSAPKLAAAVADHCYAAKAQPPLEHWQALTTGQGRARNNDSGFLFNF